MSPQISPQRTESEKLLKEFMPRDTSSMNKTEIATKTVETFLGKYYHESKEILQLGDFEMIKRILINSFLRDKRKDFDDIFVYKKIAKMSFNLSDIYQITKFTSLERFLKRNAISVQRVLNHTIKNKAKQKYRFDTALSVGNLRIYVFARAKINSKMNRYNGRNLKAKDSTFILLILHLDTKTLEFKANTLRRKREDKTVIRLFKRRIKNITFGKVQFRSIELKDFKKIFNSIKNSIYHIQFRSKDNFSEEFTISNRDSEPVTEKLDNVQLEIHPENIRRIDFKSNGEKYRVLFRDRGSFIQINCKRIEDTSNFINPDILGGGFKNVQSFYKSYQSFLKEILCNKTLKSYQLNKTQISLLSKLERGGWIKTKYFWKCNNCGKTNRSLENMQCFECNQKPAVINFSSFNCSPNYEEILNKVKEKLPVEFKASIENRQLNNKKFKSILIENKGRIIKVILYINEKIDKDLLKELSKRNVPSIIVTKTKEDFSSLGYPSMELIDLILSEDRELFAKKVTQLIQELDRNYEASRLNKMKGSMSSILTCPNEEDFEIDTFNLLRGLFKNADYWGKSLTGVKIPDGIGVFKLDRNKKSCICWDCKFSKSPSDYLRNETYKTPEKHINYIKNIRGKLNKVKVYGKLGCYGLVVDNLSKREFNKIIKLNKLNKWRGKTILIESKALVKLADANLKDLEFNDELWDMLFNKKNSGNLTEKEVDDLLKDKTNPQIRTTRVGGKDFKIT